MNNWVHVNKRMPEIGQRVVVNDLNDNYFISWLRADNEWYGLSELESVEVYRWLPLDDKGSTDRGNAF